MLFWVYFLIFYNVVSLSESFQNLYILVPLSLTFTTSLFSVFSHFSIKQLEGIKLLSQHLEISTKFLVSSIFYQIVEHEEIGAGSLSLYKKNYLSFSLKKHIPHFYLSSHQNHPYMILFMAVLASSCIYFKTLSASTPYLVPNLLPHFKVFVEL